MRVTLLLDCGYCDRLPEIPLPTLISKGGAARNDEAQPQPEISSKKIGKGQGKRSHPNYKQTTIYIDIDKVLHRQLLRMLEDSGFDGDFSEWVEQKMKDEIESQEEREMRHGEYPRWSLSRSLPPQASE